MDRRQLWILSVLGLATLTAFLGWFDYAALTAVFYPSTDAAGHARFQVLGYPNTVYPFTYVGVAVSLLGVAAFVYLRERATLGRLRGAILGLAIGNLASIGMVDAYEQVYIGLTGLTPQGQTVADAWLHFYWGTAGGVAATLGGLLVLFAVLPWARRANWTGVLLCLGVYAASMAAWFEHGYGSPQNGDSLDYAMNALSRVSSQLALVAAVSPRDFLTSLAQGLRRIRRRSLRAVNRSAKSAASEDTRVPVS
jgi:hypothetical protein